VQIHRSIKLNDGERWRAFHEGTWWMLHLTYLSSHLHGSLVVLFYQEYNFVYMSLLCTVTCTVYLRHFLIADLYMLVFDYQHTATDLNSDAISI